MTTYAALADQAAREHVRARQHAVVVREPAVVLAVGTCDICGGVRYPNPQANGRFANFQPCQAYTPSVQIGAVRGSEDARSGEQVRQREARIAGAKTYTRVNRCPNCKSTERFTVGQRCCVCVRAEYADTPTMPLLVVPVVTVAPVVKVQPKRTPTPKPARVPKPLKVVDVHSPKGEEHRAAIAAAMRVENARRAALRRAATSQ